MTIWLLQAAQTSKQLLLLLILFFCSFSVANLPIILLIINRMKDILTAKSKLQQIFLSYYFFSGAYFNKKMQNECKYRNYFFFCWFASPFGCYYYCSVNHFKLQCQSGNAVLAWNICLRGFFSFHTHFSPSLSLYFFISFACIEYKSTYTTDGSSNGRMKPLFVNFFG